jgi:tetratricopeptide (TPR) repeat protein
MSDQPYIQKDLGNHWRTFYPQIVEDVSDEFWNVNEIIESQPKAAEKKLKQIISVCGNGHIDAWLQLGQLYNDTSRPIEGNALIHKAHMISLEAFPPDFNFDNDKMLWGHMDNRPILRTFSSVALEYIKEAQYQKAIDKFQQLMKLEPDDHQGVRDLLPECFLFLKQYDELLNHENAQDEVASIEYMYAKIFAYFKLGKMDNAKATLRKAKELHPFVAEELINTKHEFPFEEFEQPMYGIPMGSRQEAFEYWHRTQKLWRGEKDLLKFIADN